MKKIIPPNGHKFPIRNVRCLKRRQPTRSRMVKLSKKRKTIHTRVLTNRSRRSLSSAEQTIEDQTVRDVDNSWSIGKYRNPCDTNALWNLKKWFMELHKDTIPEDELVPLAQCFANSEALGCSYSKELMGRLKQLGEPISRVYRNLKNNKCTPTLVPAGEVARLRRLNLTYAQDLAIVRRYQINNLRPIIPTYTLADIFQNIVVVNNSLKETIEWFERLGNGTISLVMRQVQYGVFEVKSFLCHIFITKSIGPYAKAYSQCVADLMEILKNYCYQVNYIRRFPELQYNVEKLTDEAGFNDSKSLRRDNIGYRMLQKLGWAGGPLGHKQTGIVDPINVPVKHDRSGLGCSKQQMRACKGLESQCCTMDIAFYNDLMEAALKRKPYYDLIFSPEFNETERIVLTRLAVQRRIRCETRQSEDGQSQFVVKRYPFPPHEVLIKYLVEKDPLVRKFYEVLPPKLGSIPK